MKEVFGSDRPCCSTSDCGSALSMCEELLFCCMVEVLPSSVLLISRKFREKSLHICRPFLVGFQGKNENKSGQDYYGSRR